MNTEKVEFGDVFQAWSGGITLKRNLRAGGQFSIAGTHFRIGMSLGGIDYTQWLGHPLESHKDRTGSEPVYEIVGIYST